VEFVLDHARILIAEDEPFIAFDIAHAVEDAGGEVAGPVGSVREGMALLERMPVEAAILDVNLSDRDVTPIANYLRARDIPVIFHTGLGLPPELEARYPQQTVCRKPTNPQCLVRAIERQICAAEKHSTE
jgi:DNA-binding response OmpR family regulator